MNKNYKVIWSISLLIFYSIIIFYKKAYGIFLDELALTHFALSGIMLLLLSNYKINKIMQYIKDNYKQQWENLNTYPIFGKGFVNAHRILKFAKNKDDFEDQNLKKLKAEYVEFNRFSYVVFLSPILGIIVSNF